MSNESNGRPSNPDAGLGVLSNLPRTRPQRSSARRAAARKTTATTDQGSARKAAAKAQPKAKAKPRATAGGSTAAVKPKPKSKVKPRAVPRASGATAPRTPLVKTATSTKTGRPQRKAAASPRVDESVPRQGFESEMDRASGPVQPPGGAELVATAAEIVTELAKAGVSTGERLLKDLLGHLPL